MPIAYFAFALIITFMNDDGKQINDISTADYAVALSYDGKTESAPKVAAKGQGHIAEKIIQIALEQGIEIRKDEDLIQILKAVDIDEQIPIEAFGAVAEILSYIYQANSNNK